MKIFKKTLMALLLFTAVISAGFIVSANDFKMRIDTVTVPQGYEGEVVVPVYLDDMPDGMELSCFAWEFYFDHESLTFITSKEPASFAGELIVDPDSDCIMGKIAKMDGTEGMFRFGFSSMYNYITDTGIALNLPFYVRGDLAPGRYNIVADAFSDVYWGPASVIAEDAIMLDINKYLDFGAIVVTGDGTEEYNDYDAVSSRAEFPTFEPSETYIASGIVSEVDTFIGSSSSSVSGGTNNPSGDAMAVISSSPHRGLPNDYVNDVQTIADSFDAGTIISYKGALVNIDTIKSRSGWLVCALYKDEVLVGYDISSITEGTRVSTNVMYSEVPDTAVTVVMLEDGTFDCYGKYVVTKSEE